MKTALVIVFMVIGMSAFGQTYYTDGYYFSDGEVFLFDYTTQEYLPEEEVLEDFKILVILLVDGQNAAIWLDLNSDGILDDHEYRESTLQYQENSNGLVGWFKTPLDVDGYLWYVPGEGYYVSVVLGDGIGEVVYRTRYSRPDK